MSRPTAASVSAAAARDKASDDLARLSAGCNRLRRRIRMFMNAHPRRCRCGGNSR